MAEDAARLGVPLDAGQSSRLLAFTRLLEEKAIHLGLVADSDAGRVYARHVLDCLRAAALVRSEDRLAYDLGSGAGLPGIVLAIAAPWCRFILMESTHRAAGFLELAAERLGLPNVEVAVVRVGSIREPADLATARAFAPLDASWAAGYPLLRPGGRLVYFAGERLGDPSAATWGSAEPPALVQAVRGVENTPPLVMMVRSS